MGGDDDVARFEIAMNLALPMDGVDGIGDLNAVFDHLRGRLRAAERPPVQVLHDDVVDAGVFADVDQRADVRVLQRGDDTRFPIEALAEIGVRRVQDLDRDGPAQPGVPGFVDFAHPSRTDERQNFVMAHPGAAVEANNDLRGHFTKSVKRPRRSFQQLRHESCDFGSEPFGLFPVQGVTGFFVDDEPGMRKGRRSAS